MTLTDTQLVLLSAAAQRDDYIITLPGTLKGRAAQVALTALLRRGLAEEVMVTRDQPHWRADCEGRPTGLRITAAALTELGLDPGDTDLGPICRDQARSSEQVPHLTSEVHLRPGTKQALILALMQREQGATLNEMVQATGWLPHTTRAALTGLRQRGFRVERTKTASGSCYRVVGAADGSAGPTCGGKSFSHAAEV